MNDCCINTDKEIWRKTPNDYYSDSIHVTEQNGIGINHNGHVIVAPLEKWHSVGKLFFCVDETLSFYFLRRRIAMWLLSGLTKKKVIK